jgi:hypothetical protein
MQIFKTNKIDSHSLKLKKGFCASPVIRASDFTWKNFGQADRTPRLSIDNPDVFWIVYGLSQVGSQLN